MCQFFSLVSDGKRIMYFNAKQREVLRKNNPKSYEPDSHTSIADFYGFCGAKEDALNKYEYNPLIKEFTIDQLNTKDDSKKVKKFCRNLDFATIVPELILKPFFCPLKHKKRKRVSQIDIDLLKKWASVRASVRTSVGDSIGASVWASVWDSVWDSIGTSVGASVRASVRASVWDSVRTSVGTSVGDSVRTSVWAYISSFFNLPKWKYIKHKKGKNPFQPCIDLWHRGIVPSFDGKTWRLHGHKGEVLKEISAEELKTI